MSARPFAGTPIGSTSRSSGAPSTRPFACNPSIVCPARNPSFVSPFARKSHPRSNPNVRVKRTNQCACRNEHPRMINVHMEMNTREMINMHMEIDTCEITNVGADLCVRPAVCRNTHRFNVTHYTSTGRSSVPSEQMAAIRRQIIVGIHIIYWMVAPIRLYSFVFRSSADS